MGKDETLVSGTARPSSSLSDSKHGDVDKLFHARQFRVRRMRTKILRAGLSRWLASLVLTGIIATILLVYSHLEQITYSQRAIFNALVIGSSIALALHLASTLRSYAANLRWRIAASFNLSLRELDLVLGSTSQMKVIKLLFTKPSSTIIKVLCGLWILINVGTQVLVAVTGLAYNVNERIVVGPGGVSVADLSQSGEPAYQRALVHNYGVQSSGYNVIESTNPSVQSYHPPISPVPSVYRQTEEVDTFFFYRFRDLSISTAISVPSSRQISTWAICSVPQVYTVIDATDSDGKAIPGFLVTYGPNWHNLNSTIYVREWVANGTTYISDTNRDCGTRCTHVYAFAYFNSKEGGYPSIYDCQSKVSSVTTGGELLSTYMLSDDDARWYAGAIGWAGGPAPADLPAEYAHFKSASFIDSPWKLEQYAYANGEPSSASATIQRFAIGALAAADQIGPRAQIVSIEPLQGLTLDLNLSMLFGILVGILVLQFVGLLLVVKLVGGVVVKDDSYLAVSQLLAPTVLGLGGHGSLLRGEEIATAIELQKGSNHRVRYGSETVNVIKKAAIVDVDGRGRVGRKRFENGLYD